MLNKPGGKLFVDATPNRFAAVMGTGIIATAAATLPLQSPALHVFGIVIWALSALLLILLTVESLGRWAFHRRQVKEDLRDPAMVHFYGAPAMAFLTVAEGTTVLGRSILGAQTAATAGWILWCIGTVIALAVAAGVPYLMFVGMELSPRSASGGWLMSAVPPMVAASTGAHFIAYLPAGQARLTLLISCYAMFGMSLLTSIITITLIWSKLEFFKVGSRAFEPTLWIILGPLGQSITAASALGALAHFGFTSLYAHALDAFGLLYGLIIGGFALLWIAIAAFITIRTMRAGLPFTITWWSFTFPVGTCVTGFSALSLRSGSIALASIAVILYVALVITWAIILVRTVMNRSRHESPEHDFFRK